jgi:hypothetical protein
VHYLPEAALIYRKHNNSFTNFSSLKKELDYFINTYSVRFYYIENIRPVSEKLKKQLYQKYYKKLLNYNYLLQDKFAAGDTFKKLKDGFKVSPYDYLHYYGTKNKILHSFSKIILKMTNSKSK